MGREIKRIHINFDLFEREGNTTWKGYLLDEIECPLCKGVGRTLDKQNECVLCYGVGKVSPVIEPPTGYEYNTTKGYQVWQDVSVGGPVSPVFLNPENLAKWMVENDNSITRDTSYEKWLEFIKSESSAPSMVFSGGSLGSGVSKFGKD